MVVAMPKSAWLIPSVVQTSGFAADSERNLSPMKSDQPHSFGA